MCLELFRLRGLLVRGSSGFLGLPRRNLIANEDLGIELCNEQKDLARARHLVYLAPMLFAYLVLSTGFTLPDSYGFSYTFAMLIVIANLIVISVVGANITFYAAACYFLMLLAAWVLTLVNVNEISETVNKIVFSGYIIPIVASMWLIGIRNKVGEFIYLDLWVFVGLVVLIMTIAYKVQFGFFDRQVRFFLNGPIVFGWIFALLSVVALRQYIECRNIRRLSIVICFTMAVLWTLSKGPILALLVGVFLICMPKKVFSFQLIVTLISIVALPLLLILAFPGARVVTFLERIFDLGLAAAVSDSARYLYYLHSLELLEENYWFGVGVDGFRYMGAEYPHNIFLSLLLDGGLFYFITFSVGLTFVFFGTSKLGRILLVTGLVGLLFSGDTTYLRFLFILPLSLLNFHAVWQRR